MSDHIEVNGKTYYAEWYLELANQKSRRRSERVAELERQVEGLLAENERLKAAIRKVIEGNVQETVGSYIWKNKICKHGNSVDQGCKWCIRDF